MKGVMGCANRHVDESTLEKAFVMAWHGVLENKEYFLRKWEEHEKSEELLEVYRAKDFEKVTLDNKSIEIIDINFMLRILEHIKIFENGMLIVVFLDGTKVKCKNMNDNRKSEQNESGCF